MSSKCVWAELQSMSLEEPKAGNPEGLKEAFEDSVSKMKFLSVTRSKLTCAVTVLTLILRYTDYSKQEWESAIF